MCHAFETNGALTLGVGFRFRKNTLSNIWLMTHSGDDATVYARHTFKWVADDLGCPRLSNTVSQSQVQRYFRGRRCLTIIHPQIKVYLSHLSSIRQNNSRNLGFNLIKRSVNVLYLNTDPSIPVLIIVSIVKVLANFFHPTNCSLLTTITYKYRAS